MIVVSGLKRQHEEIMYILNNIKEMINKKKTEEYADTVAQQINLLAGKLKIHLTTEDKFMYPSLLESGSEEMKSMARRYISEMGDISEKFTEYKNRFNTKTKIISDINAFKTETRTIYEILESRIEKENRLLYPII